MEEIVILVRAGHLSRIKLSVGNSRVAIMSGGRLVGPCINDAFWLSDILCRNPPTIDELVEWIGCVGIVAKVKIL